MKTTGTPAAEWPPGGASSTTSTASPRRGPTDFGALLDKHQARTAAAEGPKKEAKLEKKLEHKLEKDSASAHAPHCVESNAPEAKPAAQAPATEQQPAQPQAGGQEQPTVETPAVVVDPLAELTQPVLAEPQPQPQPQATAPAAEQPAGDVPAPQQPVVAEQVQGAAEAAVVAPPVNADAPAQEAPEAAVPVTAPQQPQQPQQASQPQQPAAPVVTTDDPQAEVTATEGEPQAPAARADKPAQPQAQPQQAHQQAGDQQPQKQGADQRPAEQPRAQVPAHAQSHAQAGAKPEPGPAPVSGAGPQAPVTAPVGTPAPQAVANAAAPALARSVPLSRAAEAVENVIRLGSARGVTHARMSLRPAELGGVEIRLQQTGQGLVASVVADGIEAAQALQQAGHDLRRQLESQGIELQRLDISYSGEDRSGARSAQTQTGEGERRSSAGNDSHATDGGDLTPTDEATATSTLELPGGVLVDVLA